MGFVEEVQWQYTYDGEQLGQGRENLQSWLLKCMLKVMVEISERIRAELGIGPTKTEGAMSGPTTGRSRSTPERLIRGVCEVA